MTFSDVALFAIGLVLLIAGAELLVRGAARLAALAGISPLAIGLTVVAYGTSTPELAVSLRANFTAQAGISVGNIVGSNICNVLLILGISATLAPLIVQQQLVRLDVPIMIGVSVLMLMFGLDGAIDRADGILFVVGAIVYTWFLLHQSRRRSDPNDPDSAEVALPESASTGEWVQDLGLIFGGAALLLFGSRWLVTGATAIARSFGLSELVIGLTVVALGTSLPEGATSVVASLRGERDIAVGNVVGSNIFNILAVLGLASVVAPNGVAISDPALNLDIPIMIAVAVACLPIFVTGNQISRWEGGLFLLYYLAYVAFLILDSTQHEQLPMFSAAMLGFALPLTGVTLGVLTVSSLRRKRQRSKLD
ncbi:calcium/sodium antiporter [Rubidibacter lacunae]|nr:calcium/sodium antiporter [Rubidibacter lacunae]